MRLFVRIRTALVRFWFNPSPFLFCIRRVNDPLSNTFAASVLLTNVKRGLFLCFYNTSTKSVFIAFSGKDLLQWISYSLLNNRTGVRIEATTPDGWKFILIKGIEGYRFGSWFYKKI